MGQPVPLMARAPGFLRQELSTATARMAALRAPCAKGAHSQESLVAGPSQGCALRGLERISCRWEYRQGGGQSATAQGDTDAEGSPACDRSDPWWQPIVVI